MSDRKCCSRQKTVDAGLLLLIFRGALICRVELLHQTLQDGYDMRFDYEVVNIPTFASTVQKSAPLHQAEMFRHHGAGQFTDIRQFADRMRTLIQNLQNPQTMRMCNRPQAFSGFSK